MAGGVPRRISFERAQECIFVSGLVLPGVAFVHRKDYPDNDFDFTH